mgnify:CR=1 FL=1
MRTYTPGLMIGIGFVLVVFGAVTPFLMVMKIIPSTFFLNFLSYAASISVVLLGFIGSLLYIRSHRDRW